MPVLTKAIMSDAGAWMARLNGPYRTRNAEQGFRRWLRDDPRHVEAFKLISVDWEGMEELRRFANVTISAPTAVQPQRSIRRRARPFLAAAAVLVLGIFGVWFYAAQLSGVTTGVGEQRTLTLKDGTKVYLNTGTHIQVRYDKTQRLIQFDSGEALFEVAQHAQWPFIVDTGERQVTALGTAFLVRKDPHKLAVTLMEGKVSIDSELEQGSTHEPATVLTPGERATFSRADAAPKLDQPPIEKLVAWQLGKFAIDKMQLSEAVAEMNRYSSTKLVIERPESRQLLISGVFSVGQSASFARAVAQSYGLQIKEEGRNIVLSGLAKAPAALDDGANGTARH